MSAPVVSGGTAYADAATRVVAFDARTGTGRWTVARARGPLTPPAVGPSAGGSGVLVYPEGLRSGTGVVAVDLATRARLWKVALKHPLFSAPSIAGGLVYFGARDRFAYAVEMATGHVAWKVRTQGWVDTSPAVAGGLAFVLAEDPLAGRSRLYALDAATGKLRWSFSPGTVRTGGSSPTVTGDRVCAGFADALVRCFEARTGTVEWSAPVREAFSPLTSPAAFGNDLYIADRNGALYRFDLRTGERLWDFQFPGVQVQGAPLLEGGSVLMGVDDGTVAAIDVATGDLVWKSTLAHAPAGPIAPAGPLLLVPQLGPHGTVVALEHGPGPLRREESPTRVHVPVAVANFAVASAALTVLILGISAGLRRMRPGPEDSTGLAGPAGADDAPAGDGDEP